MKRQRLQFWKEQFVIFFLKHYKIRKESKISIANEDQDYFSILLRELSKPMNITNITKTNISNDKKRKNVFINYFIDDLVRSRNEEIRDSYLIMKLIEKIEGLMDFFQFNNICDKSLKSLIPFLKTERITKGNYIIKCGDNWKKFYCIISGRLIIKFKNDIFLESNESITVKNISSEKISFLTINHDDPQTRTNGVFDLKRKITKNSILSLKKANGFYLDKEREIMLKKNNFYLFDKKISYYEDKGFREIILKNENSREKTDIVLEAGRCFGEYGLINSEESNFSILACEDTQLICIEKGIFVEILAKSLIKADNERRSFFKEKFDVFQSSHKFDEYYKKISVICTKKNEIIYTENTGGNFIYLIYTGNFVLEKDVEEDTNEYNKNKREEHFKKKAEGENREKYQIENRRKHNISLTDERYNTICKDNINSDKEKISKPKKYKLNKSIPLMNLVRGAFSGLEILFRENKLYKFSLRGTASLNILFKISIENLPELNSKIIKYLTPI